VAVKQGLPASGCLHPGSQPLGPLSEDLARQPRTSIWAAEHFVDPAPSKSLVSTVGWRPDGIEASVSVKSLQASESLTSLAKLLGPVGKRMGLSARRKGRWNS
jgi:hypothetical protein